MNYIIYQAVNIDKQLDERLVLSMFLGSISRDKLMYMNYDEVYRGTVVHADMYTDDTYVLERLFSKFNTDHPDDYYGRSLTAGDVVELDGRCYLCTSMGWTLLQ